LGDGAFRAGEIGRPNLRIQFVLPVEPEVIENAQWGPLWSFAVTQPAGRPYLAVLHPRRGDEPLTATLAADGHTLRVASEAFTDSLTLPPAGSAELPLLRR